MFIDYFRVKFFYQIYLEQIILRNLIIGLLTAVITTFYLQQLNPIVQDGGDVQHEEDVTESEDDYLFSGRRLHDNLRINNVDNKDLLLGK